MPCGLDQVYICFITENPLCITLLPVLQQRTQRGWCTFSARVTSRWNMGSGVVGLIHPFQTTPPSLYRYHFSTKYHCLTRVPQSQHWLAGDMSVQQGWPCALEDAQQSPSSSYQMPTAPSTTSSIVRHGQWCVVEQNDRYLFIPDLRISNLEPLSL